VLPKPRPSDYIRVEFIMGANSMSRIKIYTTFLCPYCHAAKALLDSKGVAYDEIDVSFSPQLRAEMTRLAGGRTSVPQIWVGETHVGGCDELHALDAAGELDPMLQAL
jgi:glutaredoxin 3